MNVSCNHQLPVLVIRSQFCGSWIQRYFMPVGFNGLSQRYISYQPRLRGRVSPYQQKCFHCLYRTVTYCSVPLNTVQPLFSAFGKLCFKPPIFWCCRWLHASGFCILQSCILHAWLGLAQELVLDLWICMHSLSVGPNSQIDRCRSSCAGNSATQQLQASALSPAVRQDIALWALVQEALPWGLSLPALHPPMCCSLCAWAVQGALHRFV